MKKKEEQEKPLSYILAEILTKPSYMSDKTQKNDFKEHFQPFKRTVTKHKPFQSSTTVWFQISVRASQQNNKQAQVLKYNLSGTHAETSWQGSLA